MILPAISLWQPWASALLVPELKVHETRHWRLPARLVGKRFAIHAAAKAIPRDLDEEVAFAMAERFGSGWRTTLPRGAVVGTATIAGCEIMGEEALPAHSNDAAFGHWEPGRFAWRVEDPSPLSEPIPCIGRQGWFSVEVPDA